MYSSNNFIIRVSIIDLSILRKGRYIKILANEIESTFARTRVEYNSYLVWLIKIQLKSLGSLALYFDLSTLLHNKFK